MRKVKVAFFAEILFEDKDGASRTMFQLIKRISSDRFEFMFIYGEGPDQLLNFRSLKIPTLTIPSNKNYTLCLPSLVQQKLIRQLTQFNPDIIHIATPSLLGHFAAKFAQKHHIPIITIYHTHFISYIAYYFKKLPFLIEPIKKLISVKKKSFYNRCDYIYVPSNTIRKELINYGIQASKMQLWERGIDSKIFNPKKNDPELLKQITGNSLPTLLFASRLVWEKNLQTLFRIYHRIQSRNIACNFIVAGDGQARAECEKEMKGAIFMGQLSHETLAIIYASSSLFIFPSISETYGNVVLEAMASGLPCVIASGGGSQDLIQNGVNGYSCEPDNEEEYADRIETLLTNKTLYQQFREAGLHKSEKLNWDHLAAIYFDDLEHLGKLPYIYKLTS
ncbi:glycosyltransferase family 4 protein [Olivibacter domesticus]|uniref:Glycosyltransferase involved in cell wall bisynthesis n=1 Tax=Olivibacter domesticus TaxID=407022 RepID=A0A1H7PZB2_OLID1|nr:glycosyltransferase family 1 protein [Olivibacter domesticus]SEL40926.1 Glycosyltransferase involved in cell wall bisynthesis [Olivibacter domesticus]